MNHTHQHSWVEREVIDRKGRIIYGYQCRTCLKRDYVDMTSGRPVSTKLENNANQSS